MPKLPVSHHRTTLVVALAAVCLAASFISAQQSPAKPPADQQSGNQQTDDQNQQPTETLKVNVNVVQVFFNVKDKHGALMPNLTKADFEISEDSKPQTVKYFTAETNLPLTLGILIDSSGSQLRVLDMEKEVGGAFLKQILTDKDEAFVIDFNVDASLLQDFTRDVHRLQKALNSVKINAGFTTGPIPGAGGGPVPTAAQAGTVLYDAVYLSAHDMLAKEVGRKAMILLTDGEDEGSKLKIRDAIEAAQKADAIVYVLLRQPAAGSSTWATRWTSCKRLSTRSPPNSAASTTSASPPPILSSTVPTGSLRSRTNRATRFRRAPDITPDAARTRTENWDAMPWWRSLDSSGPSHRRRHPERSRSSGEERDLPENRALGGR